MAKKDSILKKTRDILTDDLNDPDDYFLGKYWDRFRDRDSFRDRDRSFGDRFSNWRDRRRSIDLEPDPNYLSPYGYMGPKEGEEDDDRSLMERFSDWRDRNKARRKERPKGISDDARYAMRDRNTMLSNFAAQKGFKGSRGDEEREANIAASYAAHRRVLNYEGGEQLKKLKYAEGGDINDQMEGLAISVQPVTVEKEETHTMPDGTVMPGATYEEYEQMLPDEKMEEDYVDFVVSSTLEEEDQNYLESALAEDAKLSEIFDQVVESASEFSGSGPVEGLGSGVSDSIPARLSDGEFVFTAKATDEIGADNLQRMMEDAEAGADERQGVVHGGMVEDEGDPKAVPIQTSGSVAAQGNIPNVVKQSRQVEEEMLKSSPRRYYVPVSG